MASKLHFKRSLSAAQLASETRLRSFRSAGSPPIFLTLSKLQEEKSSSVSESKIASMQHDMAIVEPHLMISLHIVKDFAK
jgi:hypothetical protein